MGMFQALRGKSSSAFCLVWVVGWVSQHQVSAAKSFPPALPGEISCDVDYFSFGAAESVVFFLSGNHQSFLMCSAILPRLPALSGRLFDPKPSGLLHGLCPALT